MKTINKLIASTVLSSLLTIAPVNTSARENFNLYNQSNPNRESIGDGMYLSSLQLVNNSHLIYKDIFEQTKPIFNLEGAVENNPIAKGFFDRGLWDLYYFSSIGGMLIGNYILNSMDKKGNLSVILNNLIAIFEMAVIIGNDKSSNQDIQINIPLFYKTF